MVIASTIISGWSNGSSSDSESEDEGSTPSPETNTQIVWRLLQQGFSKAQVAKKLGISKPSVSYHCKKLGCLGSSGFQYDWRAVSAFYEKGFSVRECQAKFGFAAQSWTDAVKRGDVVPRSCSITLETILVEDRPQTGRSTLKKKLIKEKVFEERCFECGLVPLWNGKRLSLQLDHINGKSKDNRIENLRLLCPNCHSQTSTFSGRNKKQGERSQ